MSFKQIIERASVEDPEAFGLLQRALEGGAIEHPGKIEQGSDDRGARDAADHRGVFAFEGGTGVCVDTPTGAACVAWRGDIDRRTGARQNPPEGGGGAVRQDRAGTARHDSRHPASLPTQQPVTDCIDAAVDSVQATCPCAGMDAARCEPDSFELGKGDDAMLAFRERGKAYVNAHPNVISTCGLKPPM